jgi:integrase
MAEKLSKATVARYVAKAPESEVLVFDSIVPGFALRIRNARSSYVFTYRIRGRSRKVKIDDVTAISLEAARERARTLRSEVKAGIDPAAARREERQKRNTFAELMRAYLDDLEVRVKSGKRRGKQSSLAEFRRLAERSILPELGGAEVEALDFDRVAKWHLGFASMAPTGNRVAALARVAYNFGLQRRLIAPGMNPFDQIEYFRENPRRERYSLPEIERVGRALRESVAAGKISPAAVLTFRLLLFCGLRRSELLGHAKVARRSAGDGLVWGDLDLQAGLMRLRKAKAGARDVILATPALATIRAGMPAEPAADAPVCAGPNGALLTMFEDPLRRVFVKAEVPWRGVHALRRTFASVAGDQGFGEYIVAALLGHGPSNVTGGYVLAGADPLRLAAERISGELAAALDGKPAASVVAFDSKKASR